MASQSQDSIDLIPTGGQLSARIFENPNIGLPPTLFFDIEISLQPFKFEDELQETSVYLNFIDFGVRDWKMLSGSNFAFPKNPENGYIDGSMYLGGAHNPADATRIRFGDLVGNILPASIDIEFDFTYEGPAELGIIKVTWDVDLELNPQDLDRVMDEARPIT